MGLRPAKSRRRRAGTSPSPPAARSKCKHWAAADRTGQHIAPVGSHPQLCDLAEVQPRLRLRARLVRELAARSRPSRRRRLAGTNQPSTGAVKCNPASARRAAPRAGRRHVAARLPACSGSIVARRHRRVVASTMAAHRCTSTPIEVVGVPKVAPSYCSSGVAAHLPVPAACLWRVGVVQLDHGRREQPPSPAGASRDPESGTYSSSGKGPRGKIESLARCLSPPRACPPLAGGLVAVVVPRVRRADCPLSSGCCVTAPAAYPPRAPEWSTAAFMRRTKVAAIDVGCLLSAVSPVTTFLRLSRRVGGGAHRASEDSWSSWTSSTSWTS